MKFAVGVLLTTFGIFWGAEGAGASWPGGDVALLAIIPGVLLAANVMVRVLRRASRPPGEQNVIAETAHKEAVGA